jgi:hypothetical protein
MREFLAKTAQDRDPALVTPMSMPTRLMRP